MGRTWVALSAMVLGASVVGSLGCVDRARMAEITKKVEREETWRGEKYPELHEVTYKGKMYAMGSKASADALTTNGKMPKMTNKAFGFGPNGETVVFEDNKLGMADILIEQYQAKHGQK
jgi:hypothetical protein